MKTFTKAYAKVGSVAQLVDGLPSMLKALSSISSTTCYTHVALACNAPAHLQGAAAGDQKFQVIFGSIASSKSS